MITIGAAARSKVVGEDATALSRLNKGLTTMGLSVDTDLDVPYQNVIGFLIRLESFKLF